MPGIIEVKISKDGSKVELDGQGFTDSSCASLSAGLVERLGQEIDGDKKPEYYQTHIGGVNQGA